ncbi:hypothetical protein DH2020_022349 [Rehmannia glutinosa]|uniref:Differentiation-associated protein 1 n=1 Tax=Rehmannia glutinosa TaxID=99300 RepID=A0ABR0WGS2_REHGL
MAVSLNSVITFNPTANCQQVARSNIRVLLLKVPKVTSLSEPVKLRRSAQGKISRFHLLAAGSDNVATETTDNDSKAIEGSFSSDGSSANASDVKDSSATPQVSEMSNGAANSTNPNQDSLAAKSSSTVKRAPLTARERLRAARVLSRYTDSKPSKPGLQSKLLDSLRESDKGKKRPGLPEAPTNMLDDSKRGLPTGGWTINISAGMDVFLVIFSFVFISSVMFATTYIVWKVGAIHFNEY